MAEEAELYYAIDSGDSGGIARLLREGLSPNTVFEGVADGRSVWSALHLCCEKGRYDCAKVLLGAGANVEICDKWGQTPLMYCVVTEWTNLMSLLLQYGADLAARDGRGLTALHLSVNCSDDTCLSLLVAARAGLEAGAGLEGRDVLEARDVLGRSALWYAASQDGHLTHLRRLLASGASVNAVDAKDKFTPLQAALWYADRDREAYTSGLLSAGACVSPGPDQPQHTVLMTLLQRSWRLGRDITPEEATLARSFIRLGCDVDVSAPDGIYCGVRALCHPRRGTALKMAAHRGAPTMVGLLLEAGANPDLQDRDGMTALHMAVAFDHRHCIQLLLNANCRLDLRGTVYLQDSAAFRKGTTAFESALLRGHLEAARLMVEAGYDLRYEYYLWTNRNVPEPLVQNSHFWHWLLDFVAQPQDLMSLCRRVIRNSLRYRLSFVVDSLPLPLFLKGYLSYKGGLGLVS